ncbi:MAG: outer membrane beta-barrel protein [Pseudolabrys sp.]
MKRLIPVLGAGLLAAGIAIPSFAADMPKGYYAPPPPPAAEPLRLANWTGFYVGLNAGYGWGQSDWNSSVTTGSTSPGGGLFGGTIGFNGQSGAFVFGVEGDVAGSWMRDSSSTGTGICAGTGCSIQTSWFATARGRLGYSFGRALLYVTAGGAFGDVQMSTAG